MQGKTARREVGGTLKAEAHSPSLQAPHAQDVQEVLEFMQVQ